MVAFIDGLFQWVDHSQFTYPRFAILLSLLALILLSILVRDFLRTFQARPAHLPPYRWSEVLYKPVVEVPLVESEEAGNTSEALGRGLKLYPHCPFKINHFNDEVVILPHEWSDLVKENPSKTLSFQNATYDMALGSCSEVSSWDAYTIVMLRQDLPRMIDRLQPRLFGEAANAIHLEIGACADWTTIRLLPRIIQIINRISQFISVGEPLCRNERWLQNMTAVLGGTFNSLPPLWRHNRFIQPLAAWRSPGLRRRRKQTEFARELLAPVLEQRLEAMGDPNKKAPADLMQLALENNPVPRSHLVHSHLKIQTDLARVALFTTGMTLFHVLYHLAKLPEYIEPIRQEVVQVSGGSLESLDRVTLTRLVKLDSFIRECQRWCDIAQLWTMRKVLEPLQLPDGTILPVGTYLALDGHRAGFEESGLNDPYKFDGFRFERLRAMNGNENKFQAAQPSPSYLAFGYGSQSCPGRYLAVHQMKLVVAHLVINYDFKLVESMVEKPFTRAVGLMTVTDPDIDFSFKRRT